MHWITVFDVVRDGYRDWDSLWVFLPLLVAGLFTTLAPATSQTVLPNGCTGPARRIFGIVFLVFVTLFGGFTLSHSLWQYFSLRDALISGRCNWVEGRVLNFHPMPYGGHQDETFDVGSAQFSYSDYGTSAGFHNSTSHGGPIHESLYVRIGYVGNQIARLEIRNDH